MTTVMDDLTDKEQELIEMIRLVQNSRHNPSKELVRYTKELFDELLND